MLILNVVKFLFLVGLYVGPFLTIVRGKFGIVENFFSIILAGNFKYRTSRSKMVHDQEYQDDLNHSIHLLHCGDIF